MKRYFAVALVALLVVAGASAQDLSGLGRDFEVVIEELGAALLPDLEQSAIWGQYPGVASYADQTSFFTTLTIGSILTEGILGFIDDEDAFTVLNVPNLVDGVLGELGNQRVANLTEGLKTFFPLPVLRTTFGFTLPGDLEVIAGIGGFPQFLTGFATGLANLDGVQLSMLHAGTKVRKGILADTGRFPAISIGGGYSYIGFTIGYDLSTLGDATGTFADEYGQIPIGLGELNIRGDLLAQSRVHSFGLDLQLSKAFGVFVPYVGLSPYYHLATFSGSVGAGGEFAAFIDYDEGADDQDVIYNGDAPDTAWVDQDLSLVLIGGFEFNFTNFALQFNGSYSVGKGSPGAAINLRFQ